MMKKNSLHPNSALIKYMERTKAAHLVSIRFPLMASSVLFPDQEAGSEGMSVQGNTWTPAPPLPASRLSKPPVQDAHTALTFRRAPLPS